MGTDLIAKRTECRQHDLTVAAAAGRGTLSISTLRIPLIRFGAPAVRDARWIADEALSRRKMVMMPHVPLDRGVALGQAATHCNTPYEQDLRRRIAEDISQRRRVIVLVVVQPSDAIDRGVREAGIANGVAGSVTTLISILHKMRRVRDLAQSGAVISASDSLARE